MENEKDKFKEIIKNKLIDKDISTSIERIVLDMNKESFLLFDHFYDLEECLLEEREATIEEEVEKRVKEEVEKTNKKARKEGILETKTDIVLTMYKKQYDLDTISDITKLSKEEIKKIIDYSK